MGAHPITLARLALHGAWLNSVSASIVCSEGTRVDDRRDRHHCLSKTKISQRLEIARLFGQLSSSAALIKAQQFRWQPKNGLWKGHYHPQRDDLQDHKWNDTPEHILEGYLRRAYSSQVKNCRGHRRRQVTRLYNYQKKDTKPDWIISKRFHYRQEDWNEDQ
jgi:hypothetical protein